MKTPRMCSALLLANSTLKRIAATPAGRDNRWRTDFSSLAAHNASVREHQADLRNMLGLNDRKAGTTSSRVLGKTKACVSRK